MKTMFRVKIIDEVDTIRIYAPYNQKLNAEYRKYHSKFNKVDKCWVSDCRNRKFIEDALIREYGTFDSTNDQIVSLECAVIDDIDSDVTPLSLAGIPIVFYSERYDRPYPSKNVVFVEKSPVKSGRWLSIERDSLFEIRDLPKTIADKFVLNEKLNCEVLPQLPTRIVENPLEKFETDHLLQELERRKVRNEEI